MNVKFLAIILLFSFGFLQASHSRSTVVPFEDTETEIAKYVQNLQIEQRMAKSMLSGQIAMAKIAMEREAIEKKIKYRDVLYARSLYLNRSNLTFGQLLDISDKLLEDAKQVHRDASFIQEIKKAREDIVLCANKYNEQVSGCLPIVCCATCCCCGLCLTAMWNYASLRNNSLRDDIAAKKLELQLPVENQLVKYYTEIERVREESTAQIAIAPFDQAPQAVVYPMEMERADEI